MGLAGKAGSYLDPNRLKLQTTARFVALAFEFKTLL